MPHARLTKPRQQIHKPNHMYAWCAGGAQRREELPVAVCDFGIHAEAAFQ